MEIYRINLKRALFNKAMLSSILIGIIAILIGVFVEPVRSAIQLSFSYIPMLNSDDKTHLIGNSFNKATLWNFGMYFYPLIMPLICCIPFTASYLIDKKTGYSKFVIIRVSYKKYISSKLCSIFLSGFLSVFITTILFIILISIIDSGQNFRSIYNDNAFLGTLFRNNFNIYVFIYSLISGIFGGVYSIIGLAISSIIDNTLVAVISPFMLYYFSLYFSDITGVLILNPSIANNYGRFAIYINGIIIFTQLFLLFCISLMTFLYRTYWSDKYE